MKSFSFVKINFGMRRSGKEQRFFFALSWIIASLFVSLKMNSIGIALLALVWLLEGFTLHKVKAFALHPVFICCTLLFLFYVIGWFGSENKADAAFALEKKLSLPLLPAILLSMPEIDTRILHRIFSVFITGITVIMLLALFNAAYHYLQVPDAALFFYHRLVEPFHLSAITASCFCLLALILLVEVPIKNGLKVLLGLFLVGCLLLLASKLFVFLLVLLAVAYIISLKKKKHLVVLGPGIALVLTVLALSNNPVRQRFIDLSHFNNSRLVLQHYKAEDYFDGLSMRLIFVRFSNEILQEHHAWLWGVGTGDAEDLLKQKIQASGMYTGKGHSASDNGYLKYGFHNQYLQILVQMGFAGLSVFVCLLCFLLVSAIRAQKKWFIAIWVVYIIGFFTDTWLELQIGLVPFLLFMCLGLKANTNPAPQMQFSPYP